MPWILESKRLGFRRISPDDFGELCAILQDPAVTFDAWEHVYSDQEVRDWIDRNLKRYEKDGFSFFAAIDKASHEFVGAIGPLIEEVHGEPRVGIAYILKKSCWGKGYAAEGAQACMDYAFSMLGADQVIAQIRPTNLPSRKVAEKLGMQVEGEQVRRFFGVDRLHLIYSRKNPQMINPSITEN